MWALASCHLYFICTSYVHKSMKNQKTNKFLIQNMQQWVPYSELNQPRKLISQSTYVLSSLQIINKKTEQRNDPTNIFMIYRFLAIQSIYKNKWQTRLQFQSRIKLNCRLLGLGDSKTTSMTNSNNKAHKLKLISGFISII